MIGDLSGGGAIRPVPDARTPAGDRHPVAPHDAVTGSPWMTREEAAEYLRVRPRTVDRMVRERKLARHRLAHGDRPRFWRADVVALIVPDDGGGAITRQHRAGVEKMNDARRGSSRHTAPKESASPGRTSVDPEVSR